MLRKLLAVVVLGGAMATAAGCIDIDAKESDDHRDELRHEFRGDDYGPHDDYEDFYDEHYDD